MVISINIKRINCKRCSHSWIPRNNKIFVCPKCKSPRWDEEEGIIRVKKDVSTDYLLNIISNNEIFKEDLMAIGGVVRN